MPGAVDRSARRGCLKDAAEVSAIGFKAVHGGGVSGVQRVTPEVLAAMEEMNAVAPAHNPPYITAMRLLDEQLPEIPLVAAFETGFHHTIPDRNRYYAVPYEWAERVPGAGAGGSTAPAIATSPRARPNCSGRNDLRSSRATWAGRVRLCAIRDGQSVANSMGMSPQTGLPHNNRVGDFDPFALPVIMKRTGKSLDEVLDDLACRSGLLGLSGVERRRPRPGARRPTQGNARAQLALDVFAGSSPAVPGGVSGRTRRRRRDRVHRRHRRERRQHSRRGLCEDLEELGIVLDPAANAAAKGEAAISAPESRIADLDHADQRRTDRRPAERNNLLATGRTNSHVRRQSHRLAGRHAEGRLDGRPQAAGRRAVPARRQDRDRLVTTGRTFVAVDTVGAGEGEFVLITPGLECPADAGNEEPAGRHGHHRHRRQRPRRSRMRVCQGRRNRTSESISVGHRTESTVTATTIQDTRSRVIRHASRLKP